MSAFITFESAEAVNIINKLRKNYEFDAWEADIPSNIKWEKRNRTRMDTLLDKAKIMSFIALIMLIIHILIVIMRLYASILVSPLR